jgi:murein DD-endopeptidase MepM/ murein hydrolase activator NlpD
MKRRWRVMGSVALATVAAVALCEPLRHPILLWHLCSTPSPSSLEVPVDGVHVRQIADTWGAPRSGNRHHKGVDIFAAKGTPVRSSTDGIVVRRGTVDLGGNAVWVMGPGLTVHYYAHLDSFGTFGRGHVVRAGDVLGYVGDTGNAKGTPYHLHYGVYRAVVWAVNPRPLLVDRHPRASGKT